MPATRLLAAPVLLLALTAQSSAPLPREGSWEQVYRIKDVQVGKGAPADYADLIAQSFTNAFPREVSCKGADELLDFSLSPNRRSSSECEVGETVVADGLVRSSLVCQGGALAMTGQLQGTYAPERVRMEVALVVDLPEERLGDVSLAIVMDARRLGDCE